MLNIQLYVTMLICNKVFICNFANLNFMYRGVVNDLKGCCLFYHDHTILSQIVDAMNSFLKIKIVTEFQKCIL